MKNETIATKDKEIRLLAREKPLQGENLVNSSLFIESASK